ncbi:barstar family protein [Streptomyces sp. NBC_01351]|uniref:barstar family protein n=1 Tax=Streptomyces sp. NBC_01351 TaxID=2903833 RepID=UPI002E322371|nr:barstar family protein [Streptomyces sp. NBC_01351]
MSLDPQPLAPALAAAEASGWTAVRMDLDGVRTKAELMRRVADALRLPEWFGGNWDALADCLRDLSWLPVVAGRLVCVTSWREFAAARPADWETFQEILEEAVDFWRAEEDAAAFVVLLAESGPGPVAGAPPRTPRLKRRRG